MSFLFRCMSCRSNLRGNIVSSEEHNALSVEQELSNWNNPKVLLEQVYKKEISKFSRDYSLKTVKQSIPLANDHEVIKLLSKKSVD